MEYNLINPRDRRMVESIEDDQQRHIIACSLETYRMPDQLTAGDTLPTIAAVDLNSGDSVDLSGPRERPLVLFFGSYT